MTLALRLFANNVSKIFVSGSTPWPVGLPRKANPIRYSSRSTVNSFKMNANRERREILQDFVCALHCREGIGEIEANAKRRAVNFPHDGRNIRCAVRLIVFQGDPHARAVELRQHLPKVGLYLIDWSRCLVPTPHGPNQARAHSLSNFKVS